MKKSLLLVLLLIVALFAVACAADDQEPAGEQPDAGSEEAQVLKVGASPIPHADILTEVVKPLLAEEGITLEVVEFQDYILPNSTLADGDIDANYFQHIPYLTRENEEKGYGLVDVTGVHIEPFAGYSTRYDSIEDLPDGALVIHPDAVSEEGRMLALLEAHGLITLAEGVGFYGTVDDIVDNPKNLEFQGVEAAMLTQVHVDGDLAVINTNYALQAGLSPKDDSLIIESSENNPYVNVLATISGNENNELIQKLAAALNSNEVRQYIEEKFEGNVLAAF